jgi:hypothetical protein
MMSAGLRSLVLGSAHLQRAGECILHSRTFWDWTVCRCSFRQNAETSTLQACAPQNSVKPAQCLSDAFAQVGAPRGAAPLRSNIQEHFRFPAAVVFLDRETMKRHRLHVSPLLVTTRV